VITFFYYLAIVFANTCSIPSYLYLPM